MTISPKAQAKHPSHVTRSSDASTFDEVCINCGATDQVPGGWGKLAEPCPAAEPLQAERDAAAPKLPDDLAGLVERLNGVYRVPITDGLGAVGSGEEPDNPNEFVQRFETPPIQKEAAAAIQSLVARIAELEAGIADIADAANSFRDEQGSPAMTTAQTEARAVDTAVVEAIHALRLEQPGRAYDILVAAIKATLAAKDAEIAALKKEAAAFAEKVQDYSNDGHLARAARSFLDKMEGRDG